MQAQEQKWKEEQEQEARWKQWSLAAPDRHHYKQQFDVVDSDKDGFITGEQARKDLSKSGLAMDVLGKIWSLSDRNKDQKLDFSEYCIAMFLIDAKKRGETLPSILPENLLNSVYHSPPLTTGGSDAPPPYVAVAGTPGKQGVIKAASEDGISPYETMPTPHHLQATAPLVPHQMQPNTTPQPSPYAIPVLASPPQHQHHHHHSISPATSFVNPGSPQPVMHMPPPSALAGSGVYGSPQNVVSSAHSSVNFGSPRSSVVLGMPSSSSSPMMHSPVIQSRNPSFSGMSTPSSHHSGSVSPSASGGSIPPYLRSSRTHSMEITKDAPLPPPPSEWQQFTDPEGNIYFFDPITNITTWDTPDRFEVGRDDIPPPPPPLDPKNENVQTVLSDPTKLSFFTHFLEGDASNSEILFIMDVEHFRCQLPMSPTAPLTQNDLLRVEAIYTKYLKKDAPFLIKAQEKTVKDIAKSFKEAKKKGDAKLVPRDIFDVCRTEALKEIEKEQFPRFMKSMVYITMYNSLMSRGTYELPDMVWDEFLVAAHGGSEDGWDYVTETKGVLIHKKQYASFPGICVRGSGVVPIPPDEMYVFATSIDLRKEWDTLYCGAWIVEKLDQNTNTVICQYEFRPPSWAAPFFNKHDYVIIRTQRFYSDGTIAVLTRSIVHPNAPERKGYNRSEVDVSGFVIKPCTATSSVVIYVNQATMKGVPKWAEAKYINKRALLLSKIRKFAEKELKESKIAKRPVAWKRPNLN